jgi:SAM-dependent methyltransferase
MTQAGPTYASHTYDDPNGVKRWIHRHRIRSALTFVGLGPEDSLLDYGCGDGVFLRAAAEIIAPARLVGFEPDPEMRAQARGQVRPGTVLHGSSAGLTGDGRTYSRIICFEVCEHLPAPQLSAALDDIAGLLAPGGLAVFGVPIEIGPSALGKNLLRLARRHPEVTWQDSLKASMGMHVPRRHIREDRAYIYSHLGFRHADFRRQLESRFRVEDQQYLPFPWLGTVLNNEIYYRCRALARPSGRAS